METLWQDFRHAARSFTRTPGFVAAATLTLALGIGANTAIFALVDAVVLRSLPVAAPDELFAVRQVDPSSSGAPSEVRRLRRFSYPRFQDLRTALGSEGLLAAMSPVMTFVTRAPGSDATATAEGQLVSGRFFDTMGVAVRGRPITDADNELNAPPVAVISEAWRTRRFAADDVLGREVVINDVAVTIIGVTPAGFAGAWADAPVDVWLPAWMQHPLRVRPDSSAFDADMSAPWQPQDRIAWLNLIGRAPRGSEASVARRLEAANRAGLQRYADAEQAEAAQRLLRYRVALDPLAGGYSNLRTDLTKPLRLLTALVALVLLVACINVANLLLARAAGRHEEIALRASLGASWWRLARQCLAESLLLGALGSVVGIAAGLWTSRLLAGLLPETARAAVEPLLASNGRVVAFAAGVALGTSLLFGLLPAVRTTRLGTRRADGRRTIASMKGMRPLVAAQVALCFVVVTAAALLGRSLVNMTRFDPGFDRGRLVTVGIDPLFSAYAREELPNLYRRVLTAVEAVPPVVGASVSQHALLSGSQGITNYLIEGYQPATGEEMDFNVNQVSPGYFATVGMRMIDGREFIEQDETATRRVAVINETLARRYFAGRRVIGLRIGKETPDIEIVGVVRDSRFLDLRVQAVPLIYLPINQQGGTARTIQVRVAGDPAAAVGAIHDAIQRAEPRLRIDQLRTLEEQIAINGAREAQMAYLSSAFGALALVLACVGLYGVLSYAVARRSREVGVRIAVGATPGSIVRLVLSDGAIIGVSGLIAGLFAALGMQRLMRAVLFEVNASDPAIYAAVALALGAAAFGACYLPARRAASVDPNTALRADG